MDLSKILGGKLEKDFVVQMFKEQSEVFDAGLALALRDEQPLSWRATWILKHSMQKNDARVFPLIDELISMIPKRTESHQRETINVLSKMTLNDEQEGKMFDLCMTLWENLNKPPAIRYVAFKFIYTVCEKYPDLNSELEFICQEQYLETLSPGIKKSIMKLIG